MKNEYNHCFFVEYYDKVLGCEMSDTWSARTLNEELNRDEVIIHHVELSYSVMEALGLVED